MSTITVANVKSNSSSPPTFQNTSGTEIGRLCRAFVSFNGVTNTIGASYNVSSITKNGAADYTVTFATAMADTNYVFTSSGEQGNQINVCDIPSGNVATYKLAGSLRFTYAGASTSATRSVNTDPVYCGLAFFR